MANEKGRVNQSVIKQGLSAEFDDTSFKSLLQTVQELQKGAWLKHKGRVFMKYCFVNVFRAGP